MSTARSCCLAIAQARLHGWQTRCCPTQKHNMVSVPGGDDGAQRSTNSCYRLDAHQHGAIVVYTVCILSAGLNGNKWESPSPFYPIVYGERNEPPRWKHGAVQHLQALLLVRRRTKKTTVSLFRPGRLRAAVNNIREYLKN